jgi:hypothetical protein
MEVRKLNPLSAEINFSGNQHSLWNIFLVPFNYQLIYDICSPSPKAIVYFQFLPAVAVLRSYGAVNLETENGKLKSYESC